MALRLGQVSLFRKALREVILTTEEKEGHGSLGPKGGRRQLIGATAVDNDSRGDGVASAPPEVRQHHLAPPGPEDQQVLALDDALLQELRGEALQVLPPPALPPIFGVAVVCRPRVARHLNLEVWYAPEAGVDGAVCARACSGGHHGHGSCPRPHGFLGLRRACHRASTMGRALTTLRVRRRLRQPRLAVVTGSLGHGRQHRRGCCRLYPAGGQRLRSRRPHQRVHPPVQQATPAGCRGPIHRMPRGRPRPSRLLQVASRRKKERRGHCAPHRGGPGLRRASAPKCEVRGRARTIPKANANY
mmetsp:Transcript_37240/g.96175  ORF Transcript_37240/g.96175 Transcript_37240/m.96175 type:complete len:302 (-) Transcript_37240:2-907(-)